MLIDYLSSTLAKFHCPECPRQSPLWSMGHKPQVDLSQLEKLGGLICHSNLDPQNPESAQRAKQLGCHPLQSDRKWECLCWWLRWCECSAPTSTWQKCSSTQRSIVPCDLRDKAQMPCPWPKCGCIFCLSTLPSGPGVLNHLWDLLLPDLLPFLPIWRASVCSSLFGQIWLVFENQAVSFSSLWSLPFLTLPGASPLSSHPHTWAPGGHASILRSGYSTSTM